MVNHIASVCFFLLCGFLSAVEVELPMLNRVRKCTIDEKSWVIDHSMWQYISNDKRIINQHGARHYKFNTAKIGPYYLQGNTEDSQWSFIDAEGNEVFACTVEIYPDSVSATKAALNFSCPWDRNVCTQNNTYIEQEKGCNFYFRWWEEPMGENPPITGRPDRVLKDGILLKVTWWTASEKLSYSEQKALLLQFIEIIKSGKEHKSYENELREILLKKKDEWNLRNYPTHKMPRYLPCYRGTPDEFLLKLKEASKEFVHPRRMWGRPSFEWFGRFDRTLLHKQQTAWNERGDMVTLALPRTKTRFACKIKIYLAHATSEYNAFLFIKGFVSDEIRSDLTDWSSFAKKYRVLPRLIGEYDLALKPQLDDSGALIPNSEESDICFVRNNTAVRVVADRPDVSVLWIAKKIDEELIAAGKGEPPTWSPPKKHIPGSAARQQPVTVPSTQH